MFCDHLRFAFEKLKKSYARTFATEECFFIPYRGLNLAYVSALHHKHAKRSIEEHIKETDLKIGVLAKTCNLSTRYFNKLFYIKNSFKPIQDYNLISFNSVLDIGNENNQVETLFFAYVYNFISNNLIWFFKGKRVFGIRFPFHLSFIQRRSCRLPTALHH